jgi:Flp pilus assembly protein TadG
MIGRHRQRGSAIAETAIVMTVALMLLFGIIDFGRALYTYHTVASMARQGARWAMVRGATCGENAKSAGATQSYCSPSGNTTNCAGGDDCASLSDVETYVESLPIGVINPSSLQWTGVSASTMWPGTGTNCVTTTDGNNSPGCIVVVTVSYPFNFLLPFMPANFTMSSTSTMYIAQ